MNITIIGTGYVGLVTGACLAEVGNKVTCLDVDLERINHLKDAKVPFYEPNLDKIIKTNLSKQNLNFTTSYDEALSSAEVVFICVGTPEDKTGKADLSYLDNTVDQISESLKSNECSLIAFIKSTVPSGTCNYVQEKIDLNLKGSSSKVIVASNPEFLKEGSAVTDFMSPDRIIIGTDSAIVRETAELIYRPVSWKSNRIKFVSIEAAEIIKYASNSFLATKISFINEIAKLCDQVGADITEVREGVGLDSRIGNSFLYAGLGFGGSCFPKDIKALVNTFDENDIEAQILKASINVNLDQTSYFLKKIHSFYSDDELRKKTICFWGLSFKPETDDVRESISLRLINLISKKVNSIKAYDPVAMENAKKELPHVKNITFMESSQEALKGSDALVIATEWREFWNPEIKVLQELNDRVIFDGRNILDKKLLEEEGFSYFGVGR